VTVALPGDHQRWRCGGCGNLTRFDVARSRRTTEFWHFDLAGDHEVEDSAVREEVVEAVTCRWCGRDDAIEVVDRAGADVAGSPGTCPAQVREPGPMSEVTGRVFREPTDGREGE
jgi:hypothetical protein